jgi:transposase
MNPIENIWDHIDKRLRKLKPQSTQQLTQMIEEVWCDITAKYCKDLVDSMPRRMAECIRVKGGTMAKY